jgi:predicted NBD/HSP70 family sugar kinase
MTYVGEMPPATIPLNSLQRKALLLLIRHGSMPRSKLVEMLGVSRPRLSPEIAQLIEARMLDEYPAPTSTGGRRGSWLRLGDSRFGAVCGIDIDADRTSIALTTLAGDVLSRQAFDTPAGANPLETLTTIGDRVTADLERMQVRLRACGVSIAADVDRFGNLSDPPPTMPQWAGVGVGEHFARLLEVATFVENDVNVLAIADGARGAAGADQEIYAVVKISSGVGCGLIANGIPIRGTDGHAGDIGHICIDPSIDALCACGNRGCLEAVVSTAALAREADAAGLVAVEDDIDALITAVVRGEAAAASIVRTAGRRVGFALAALVTVVNPGAIYIASSLGNAEPMLLDAIRDEIYKRVRPAAVRRLAISPSTLGSGDAALGAAVLACRGLVSAR